MQQLFTITLLSQEICIPSVNVTWYHFTDFVLFIILQRIFFEKLLHDNDDRRSAHQRKKYLNLKIELSLLGKKVLWEVVFGNFYLNLQTIYEYSSRTQWLTCKSDKKVIPFRCGISMWSKLLVCWMMCGKGTRKWTKVLAD